MLNGRLVPTPSTVPRNRPPFSPSSPTSISRRYDSPSLTLLPTATRRTHPPRRSPHNGLSRRPGCSSQLFLPPSFDRHSAAETRRRGHGRRKPGWKNKNERGNWPRESGGRGRGAKDVGNGAAAGVDPRRWWRGPRHLREPLFVSPPGEISAKFTVETRPINFTP